VKFFTPEWTRGDVSDEESDAIVERYAAHLAVLAPTLPPALQALAYDPALHDAIFGEGTVDHRRRRLVLAVRCGDQQMGYEDREMVYDGVDLSRLDQGALAAAVADPKTELLYDEIDRGEAGAFVHRILFWPTRVIEIVFEEFRMRSEPRPDRHTGLARPRYVEIGAHVV
jgi:hypothetical protein